MGVVPGTTYSRAKQAETVVFGVVKLEAERRCYDSN
jgi:hypothetical protein